jgi:FixJ family two-component response regulator
MSGATVYVIDDDAAVRDSLRVALEVDGYAVLDFASAVDFLRLARPGGRCCILADMHMPAMNGLELLDHLRANDTIVPAIVMTGASNSAIEQAVAACGAVLLKKPFSFDELIGSIERALAGALPH